MNFNELNLKEPILRAISELNYTEPTPIQEKTIPLLLEGKDLLGCAQTGSGKTAAFTLPILHKLSQEAGAQARALIMTPTRELAMQIRDNINEYGKYLDLKASAIYGGVEYETQLEELAQGVDIIVATPGRLMDLMEQGEVKLNKIQMLVLDEADRMLDMGFVKAIRYLVKRCPKERQTIMFSATMPKPIERLADTILNDPETIIQNPVTSTVETISQYVYFVDEENKLALITSLVKKEEVQKAIVFTNTRQTAELVTKHFMKVGVRARAIHSEKSQNSRQDAIIQFQKNHIKVLVATDVAARGIDIAKVSHVFNYDIPEVPESYIHRIGRTGRAGEEGVAINLCCIDQMDDFRRIEGHISKIIPPLQSEWPMRNYQRKPKPSKRKVEEDDPLDIKKVKDVSLSGKPIQKRSQYQYRQHKFAGAKDGYKGREKAGFKGKEGSRDKVTGKGMQGAGKKSTKKSQAASKGKSTVSKGKVDYRKKTK